MTWWDNRVGHNASWGDHPQHIQRVWLAGYDGIVDRRVLEIGYGTGKDHANIYDKVAVYRGYDLTPSFQEVCKSRWPDGDFRIGDITAIPEPDQSWELVFCRHILEHIEDWQTALQELWRVTKEELVILSWRGFWDSPTKQRNKEIDESNPPLHCWRFNRDEFMDVVNGLDNADMQTVEMVLGGPIHILSRGNNARS